MCDFFSYTIELRKRLDANKMYMQYVTAKQLFLDIFFVGTVLAGLNRDESASLFLELSAVSDLVNEVVFSSAVYLDLIWLLTCKDARIQKKRKTS